MNHFKFLNTLFFFFLTINKCLNKRPTLTSEINV